MIGFVSHHSVSSFGFATHLSHIAFYQARHSLRCLKPPTGFALRVCEPSSPSFLWFEGRAPMVLFEVIQTFWV